MSRLTHKQIKNYLEKSDHYENLKQVIKNYSDDKFFSYYDEWKDCIDPLISDMNGDLGLLFTLNANQTETDFMLNIELWLPVGKSERKYTLIYSYDVSVELDDIDTFANWLLFTHNQIKKEFYN